MGKPKGKKQYSKEFKEKAVKLVLEGIKSQRRIAEEIGVNVNSLQKWKKEYLENQDPEKVRRKAEEVEIGRLRKELKEAKLELEILKKAVAYFSREQL